MRGIIVILFVINCFSTAFAQLNVELLAKRSYGTTRLSNIWGWTAPDGTEYALVGTQQGVSIVSLKNPRNPMEVAMVPGSTSIWRELKTWGNHAYVVTDQPNTTDGLLIIDLSKLPDSVSYVNWRPNIPGLGTLTRSHTLFVDEKGICYLFGSNLNRGGAVLVDVNTNPKEPVYLRKGAPIYIHDGYVRNNILYAAEIYEGRFAVYDMTADSARLLATQLTPGLFTHNTWLSNDGKYLYTTDEVGNAPIGAYDVSNLNDIKELDQFRRIETLNRGVVPHNTHVKDSFLLTAYYTDGVNILDASQPDKLIEVGHYDTYPAADGGFNGAWGVYPYFPSGTIVVSDIQNGLYVLKPTYVKAAFLQGLVTDSLSGQPISQVNVVIQSAQLNQVQSELNGSYKTGQAAAGTFNVIFSKPGYYSKTVSVNLQNGATTALNVKLLNQPTYQIVGRALAQSNGSGVPQARILVTNDTFRYETTADATGNFNLSPVLPGRYDIYAAAWGYRYAYESAFTVDNNKTITLTLPAGYEDNFQLDLGWQTFSEGATSGFWQRAVPIGTFFNGILANPNQDSPEDIGDMCYLTGNGGGNAGDDDVDGGKVSLISPPMDLKNYRNPTLQYQLWFFNGGGSSPADDSLLVKITNGRDTVTVEKVIQSQSAWRAKSSIPIKHHLNNLNDSIRVLFETSDNNTTSHLLEAAVDAFAVVETTSAADPFAGVVQLQAYPNPFKNQLMVRLQLPNGVFQGTIQVWNALGQLIKSVPVNSELLLVELAAPGVYWLKAVSAEGKVSAVTKVIKVD